MNKEPIDYDSPLGVSKKEWTKVLGVNLALLLTVYVVALICTLCGSDLFLLKFFSADLQRIEETLRGWRIYPLVPMAFAAIELTFVCSYVAKAKPKWWLTLAYFATCVVLNLIFTATLGYSPSFANNLVMGICFIGAPWFLNGFKLKEKWFIYLFRLLISLAVMLLLNGAITLFRNGYAKLWDNLPNTAFFALSVEYDLSLALTLGFLTLAIPWEKKGGNEQCPTGLDVSGSSPSTTNSLQKNSKIAKNKLSPQYLKRLRWLKVKVIAIQTLAFVVIAALPWFAGKPVEFALVYASFCLTRICLGFNRSLHFKSELSCVTIGALTFWGLTFLSPSAEASIILSLVYGCATALGFRLYWELHDLMMYKKAAKTDRYAMFYVVFKGNVDPKHINGVMRAKGYNNDNHDIKMVQMYMAKEKVDYIAEWTAYAKITIEKRLTEIAYDLYQQR